MREKLIKLDNKKLLDVVKNYRQYNYDIEIRNTAIKILEERGITETHILMTGNLNNFDYTISLEYYNSYIKNSKISMISYISFIFCIIITFVISIKTGSIIRFIDILGVISLISFYLFLILSLINQYNFYKIVDKESKWENILIICFLGLPFFFILYFDQKNKMKNKLHEIT